MALVATAPARVVVAAGHPEQDEGTERAFELVSVRETRKLEPEMATENLSTIRRADIEESKRNVSDLRDR